MSRRPPTNPFFPLIEGGRVAVLDGGLATALESRGQDLSHHLWSARVLVEQPDEVSAVHEAYINAGADCISTATYQATVAGFTRLGMSREEALAMLDRSVELALQARERACSAWSVDTLRPRPLVAASIGPYGAFLTDGSEYTGAYDLDSAGLRAFHVDRFLRLAGSAADLIAFETIPSLVEARVLAELTEESDRWAWLSFSCRDGGHINDGTPIEAAVALVQKTTGLAAIGVNCTHPSFMPELIHRIGTQTDLPILVYPNSGEVYDASSKSWSGDAGAGWEEGPAAWIDAGARIIGGCCRIGPELIERLRNQV